MFLGIDMFFFQKHIYTRERQLYCYIIRVWKFNTSEFKYFVITILIWITVIHIKIVITVIHIKIVITKYLNSEVLNTITENFNYTKTLGIIKCLTKDEIKS